MKLKLSFLLTYLFINNVDLSAYWYSGYFWEFEAVFTSHSIGY